MAIPALVAVTAVVAVAYAASPVAGKTHKPCKPPIFTTGDVAKAIGKPVSEIIPRPVQSISIPPLHGQPAPEGKIYECDWELVHWSERGIDEGRVSLYVFPTPEAAGAWFDAYTRAESPPCRKVVFSHTACIEKPPVVGGAFALFQTIKDQYVVWVHLRQEKYKLAPLERLATSVLARAPRLT
jgi:hypothetical protein